MLTDEEVMLLVQLEYLGKEVENAAGIALSESDLANVAGIVRAFDEPAMERLAARGVGFPSGPEWTAILRAIKANARLMELRCVMRNNEVFATCYLDSFEDAYVTFRGTATGEEWLDDVKGAFGAETESQKKALGFIESLPFDNMTVAGHSKGGNKAQYIAILSKKVARCISMDGQGFSREFLEKYPAEIAANASKIRNYSLATDYVHIHLFEIPGAEHIFCEGDQRLAGVRNHSSSAFYQYELDAEGHLQIVMTPEGQTNLIQTTENEGMQYLHEFSRFLLDNVPDERKEEATERLGNALAMAMSPDYTVQENGITYSHNNLLAYIFSNQETAALLLAYLLKFADKRGFSESQFLALLDAFGLTNIYRTLYFAVHQLFRESTRESGKSLLNYLLEELKADRRNYLIETSLVVLHRTWLKGYMQRKYGVDVDLRKLWREVKEEYRK